MPALTTVSTRPSPPELKDTKNVISFLRGCGGATAGGAAIASGMASVGATVGGGMAAGAIITATAPVAIIGAIGYGLYKWFED